MDFAKLFFEDFLPFLVALMVAISVHECAHAWTANQLGDATAKRAGRITLNPLKHLDPLGTLMIFLVRFGWGKPTPVNPYNLKHPKRDQALIAVAGPISNFLTAAILSIPMNYFLEQATHPFWVNMSLIVGTTIALNVILMVFNLIPIAPLDGSDILYLLIPDRFEGFVVQMERNGPLILFALVIMSNIFGLPIFSVVLGTPVNAILTFLSVQ